MYRSLDSTQIVATLEQLQRRVAERFPQAGLSKVCGELAQVARENDARAHVLARPNYLLRGLSIMIILAGLALIAFVATQMEVKRDTESIYSTLQGIEAGLNIILVVGGTVIFLATLEGRWKRQRALRDLDELRSIIHVIDMHQLTKDPGSVLTGATPSSPLRTLTPGELVRYLDYCSEMLSLAAKVAAVYAQSTKDPQVVAASSDLQQLTANLSAKIWQKIRIAQAASGGAATAAGPSNAVGTPTATGAAAGSRQP